MRLKLLACKALTRELSYLCSLSQNNLDLTFIRQGYHDAPDVLRRTLQSEIDAIESGKDPHTNLLREGADQRSPLIDEDFDAILIGYGLCSNGTVGLHSSRYPLVIPRGHDCITFFLGSKERYAEYFKKLPGCFWYTESWIENSGMPCERSEQRQREYYLDMGYDEEDLDFFMEQMNGWTKVYHHAAYIRMPFFDREENRQFTKDAAAFYGWDYHLIEGDMGLLERFIAGKWDPAEFLVVPPGYTVAATGKEDIITCVPYVPEENAQK